MGKFIFLSFAFLGLVFYELSGGSEFDAEELRLSRLDPVTAQQLPTIAIAETTPKVTTQETAATATVTRASFDPNVLETSSQAVTQQAVLTTAVVAVEQDTQTLILPSLITQDKVETVTASLADDTSPVVAGDIRSVTGNRVNMRGGPGTSFTVVGKLTRGQEVEILADPGDGWVRLRPLDGGSEGWMADFLLTSG